MGFIFEIFVFLGYSDLHGYWYITAGDARPQDNCQIAAMIPHSRMHELSYV